MDDRAQAIRAERQGGRKRKVEGRRRGTGKKPESWEIGRQTSDGRGQKLEVVTIEK